jgi:hypothetical protein
MLVVTAGVGRVIKFDPMAPKLVRPLIPEKATSKFGQFDYQYLVPAPG